MLEINLLPPIQKQKRVVLGILAYITLGFVAMLAIVAGFIITLTTIRLTINDKVNNYRTDTVKIDKQLATYKSLESDVTQTNSKLKIATTTLQNQSHPMTILKALADHVGGDVLLASVAAAAPTSTKPTTTGSVATTPTSLQLTITGNAKSRSAIIDFRRALEGLPSFLDVTTTSLQSNASNQTWPFTFSITTTYQNQPSSNQKSSS